MSGNDRTVRFRPAVATGPVVFAPHRELVERVNRQLVLFDWCAPGRSPSQHAKCRRSYTMRMFDGPRPRTVTRICECPVCNHPPNPSDVPEED